MKMAFTLEEAAEQIGVSDRHLRKFIDNGKLKCFRLGRNLRISLEALQDFIRQQEALQGSDLMETNCDN